MKIVVDCNVMISAGITDGICAQVVQSVISSHTWIMSLPILEEYEEVCRRPRFQKDQPRLSALLACIMSVASLVDDPKKLSLDLPDQDDVIYLETAYAGSADILITGNREQTFPEILSRHTSPYAARLFEYLVSPYMAQ